MLNWRELPFVRLLIPYITGIILALSFNYTSPFILPAIIGLAVCALLYSKFQRMYRHRWLFGLIVSLAMLLLGYGITTYKSELNDELNFSKLHPLTAEIILAGKVNDAPIKRENWIKIELQVLGIGNSKDSLKTCRGNLLLYLERDSAAETLRFGDDMIFVGNVSTIEPPKNPDAFDYRRYLHFQNIHHQAYVRGGNWSLIKKQRRFSLYGLAINQQNNFTQTLRKHLPTTNEFAVGAALILGYRDEMPEEVLTAYSQTGAMHVLAVSGLHVGIVFLILNFFFKRVKWKIPAWRYLKMLLILVAIWAFALVTGASPSVLRATVMFSFVTAGEAMYRHKNFYNTLAASAFCLLLYNPLWLASVSFQLSYLAVFGIVYFQPRFSRMLPVKQQWLNYCWELVCVSLAAQLMTLPLTLYYFNQFPTYFWLSSLLLVPLAGVELGLGLLLLLTEAVWPAGAVWVGKLLWGLLWIGNESVAFIQKMPGALVDGIWVSAHVALLLYIALSAGMVAISFRKFKWALLSLSLILAASVHFSFVEFRRQDARLLAVYHVYKQTAIDFIDGKTVYSLVNKDISKKTLDFAAKGFRCANGINEASLFHLEDTATFMAGRWFYRNGFVQFYDSKLAIVERPLSLSGGEKIRVDYLLLRNSPKVEIARLREIFDFKTIIFDASNKKWQLEQWKNQCVELEIEYFDVNEKGAFVLDLNDGRIGRSR